MYIFTLKSFSPNHSLYIYTQWFVVPNVFMVDILCYTYALAPDV